MISALLLGTALALSPASSRLISVREPTQINDTALPDLEFLARATETSFMAVNPTANTILLVFSHERGGVHGSVLIASGDQLEARLPRGTLSGLRLEVISLDPAGWSSTGTLALDAVTAEGVRALWIERQGDGQAGRLGAWILDRTGRVPILPESDLGWLPLSASSPHVPGAIPRRNKYRQRAPKIRRDPLPPL